MPRKEANKARKRKNKDLDEIFDDLQSQKLQKLVHQEKDIDLPGEGQFYCIECARYFLSEDVQNDHKKTKAHKRRLKALKSTPYSQKEADAAGGIGNYVPLKR